MTEQKRPWMTILKNAYVHIKPGKKRMLHSAFGGKHWYNHNDIALSNNFRLRKTLVMEGKTCTMQVL